MEQGISWSAPEFAHYEKGVSWYWLVICVALAIVGTAIFFKNFLFAFFIAVASFLVLTWGHRAPRTIHFTLSEKGLAIGGKKFYPFDRLTGFAFVPTREDAELDELMFYAKGRLSNWMRIIISAGQREEIKTFLLRFLPELDYEESLADHISRILRF